MPESSIRTNGGSKLDAARQPSGRLLPLKRGGSETTPCRWAAWSAYASSGSVNASGEYSDWDDIAVLGFVTTTTNVLSTATTSALPDGTWYYNLRTVDAVGNWSSSAAFGPGAHRHCRARDSR